MYLLLFLFGLMSQYLTEQFLQGNVPLIFLLNEETLFMYWRRSAIKEVNNWALNFIYYYSLLTIKEFSFLEKSYIIWSPNIICCVKSTHICISRLHFQTPFKRLIAEGRRLRSLTDKKMFAKIPLKNSNELCNVLLLK